MIYEQLNDLCIKKGTTPTAFVKDVLHLSTSKVTAWKSGSIPKYKILNQIANYFDVSVGYLFDGKKAPPRSFLKRNNHVLKNLIFLLISTRGRYWNVWTLCIMNTRLKLKKVYNYDLKRSCFI